MMNLKRCESKQSWPNLKALARHFSGVTEENHEKPHDIRSPG
jgi:hypothetical protein